MSCVAHRSSVLLAALALVAITGGCAGAAPVERDARRRPASLRPQPSARDAAVRPGSREQPRLHEKGSPSTARLPERGAETPRARRGERASPPTRCHLAVEPPRASAWTNVPGRDGGPARRTWRRPSVRAPPAPRAL